MIIRSTRVVLPDGTRPAAVVVRDGRVAAVRPYDEPRADVDHGDLVVSPGLVDTHVHVNEPGRTAWEGFATATAAAACGGVTTIVDMPLNSIPPTTTLDHLTAKRAAATAAGCAVDVGFWGGIVPGGVADQAVLHDAGVFGFKAFLSPSGVEEFPHVGESALGTALAENARLGALTVVHAESPPVLDAAPPCTGPAYRGWLESRPPAAEIAAITGLAELAARTGARAHVLHLSAADALPALAATGLTAETCPHYLTLASDEVGDGQTAYKCAPPIRDPANRDRLWAALAAGAFAGVVSDHSPATADLKLTGDFGTAWGGIASLQLGLSLVWTAARARGHTPDDLVRWMSSGPADLVGLTTKGAIAPGRDADLVVWDPDATFVVDPAVLHHRNPVTPYAGRTLAGVVAATYLRGERIAAYGQLTGARRGRLVERGAA